MWFCTDVLVDHSQIRNFHYVYHNYATNSLYIVIFMAHRAHSYNCFLTGSNYNYNISLYNYPCEAFLAMPTHKYGAHNFTNGEEENRKKKRV